MTAQLAQQDSAEALVYKVKKALLAQEPPALKGQLVLPDPQVLPARLD
jgi:hypothetical protein